MPGAAVDEDEPRPEDEALALHVGAHRHHAAAAERVVDFLLALDDAASAACGVNITVPVTISGCWYSSPICFQYSTSANRCSYGSRSLSSLIAPGAGCARSAGRLAGRARFGGDFHQRQDVGVDDAQLRLGAQLAAQQARRFEVAVHVVGAAGDEAGDEHALERRRRRASAGSASRSGSRSSWCTRRSARPRARLLSVLASRAVIDFLEQLVVLFDERVVRLELERLLVGGARLVELAFVLVARSRGCCARRRRSDRSARRAPTR